MVRRASRARKGAAGVAVAEPDAAEKARLTTIIGLCHRRWSLPILAELQREVRPGGGGGAKFVTLANRLNLSRETLRDTLDDLIARDYLMRNPGVGHPMRPEYLLTEAGHDAGPAAAALIKALHEHDLEDVALRKWSLPVLYVIAQGLARFGHIRSALPGLTSRALALALKDLHTAQLIRRSVTHEHPPGAVYEPAIRSRKLARMLAPLG
jgi:DNA-binding HxlR family transcriptional regulator